MNFNYRDRNLWTQVAIILVIIGGFNLGIAGLLGRDIIMTLLGVILGRIIFILIGIGAAWFCYAYYIEKKPIV